MDGPMKRQRLESTSSDSNDSISHTPQEDSLSIHSLEQKQTDGNKEDKLTEFVYLFVHLLYYFQLLIFSYFIFS